MKQTLTLFVLLVIFCSIVSKPKPKDCGCSVKLIFYKKGKKVHTDVSATGAWFTDKKGMQIIYHGKTFVYDSLDIIPIN